jgi:cell division protein FtsA
VARKGEIVGAIDFGSREVRVIIAQQTEDGSIKILGHGTAPSRGCIHMGVIQDIDAARRALHIAVQAAEKEANCRAIPSFFCGVNGRDVDWYIREGTAKLDNEVVDNAHMDEALELTARDILAAGKRVISSITSQEWYVDDLRVAEPRGIRGSVIKARVHSAVIPAVIEDNLAACIDSLGRELEDTVYMPLAAALGCLTPEDMELGVAVLDMGRSTTGLAVYRDRRILATQTFEWGGYHIIRDVAAGLQVTFEEASDLVMEYGVPMRLIESGGDPNRYFDGDDAEQPSMPLKLKTVVRGGRGVALRGELDQIIYERSHELLHKARQFLYSRGLAANLVRGVVITGGTAAVKNMTALAEAVFDAPVRQGLPDGIDMLPPACSAPAFTPVIGVARHGLAYRAALRSGRIETRRSIPGALLAAMWALLAKYFF